MALAKFGWSTFLRFEELVTLYEQWQSRVWNNCNCEWSLVTPNYREPISMKFVHTFSIRNWILVRFYSIWIVIINSTRRLQFVIIIAPNLWLRCSYSFHLQSIVDVELHSGQGPSPLHPLQIFYIKHALVVYEKGWILLQHIYFFLNTVYKKRNNCIVIRFEEEKVNFISF